jgi:hypothetical protein
MGVAIMNIGRSRHREEGWPRTAEARNAESLLNAAARQGRFSKRSREPAVVPGPGRLGPDQCTEFRIHAPRHSVQTMFRSLVTNLDSVQLIKEEDAGECYYKSSDEILIPDFRIVTDKGDPLLIETKNHFTKDPLKRYRIAIPMYGHSGVMLISPAYRFALPSTGLRSTSGHSTIRSASPSTATMRRSSSFRHTKRTRWHVSVTSPSAHAIPSPCA